MSTPIQPLTYEKDAVTELLAIDGSLLLRIRRDAIQRLRRLIYEGVRAIPQQPGLEFGGLCVASKPVSWGLTETVIDFVPVEIQYQYGPRFRACPADGAVFEEALEELQRNGESRVVGCFRSHLAADLQIRKEDRWLMNLLLGERGGFLMLVQPMFDEVNVFSFGAGGTPLDTLPVTRFSLRDGGPEWEKLKRPELPSTAADPPFASIKAASGPLALNRAPAVLAGSGNGNPAVPGDLLNPASPPTGSETSPGAPWELKKNIWYVALALLFLALAMFIVVGRSHSAASQTGLAISAKGTSVEITWNVSSPVVKRAVRGTLFTTDDLNSSQVNLTAAQVHAGRYVYPRTTGDLFCELTLYQADNSFVGETKTLRLKAGNVSAPASPAPGEQPDPAFVSRLPPKPAPNNHTDSFAKGLLPKPAPNNHTDSVAQALPPKPIPDIRTDPVVKASPSKPAPDIHADSAADSDSDSGETFVIKNDRVPFVSPPANERVRGPAIAKPPDVEPNPAPITAALPAVTMPLKPPAPPVTPPARTAAAVPQPVTFAAPVPVKRVPPVVPPGARSLLHDPVVVTVVVDIDAQGKVTAARLSGVNKGLQQLLAPNSLQAAKSWRFEPALRNGVPVASQTELSFRFARP